MKFHKRRHTNAIFITELLNEVYIVLYCAATVCVLLLMIIRIGIKPKYCYLVSLPLPCIRDCKGIDLPSKVPSDHGQKFRSRQLGFLRL